ncbi:MAG: hypothetical protein ACPGSB_02890 [Opitutales bacterium]
MKPPIVVDKSYAHSSNPRRLMQLAEEFTVLVPSAFFYEVARTELEKRRKAIHAFPEFQMLHILSLMRMEVESRSPLMQIDYRAHEFNPDFVSGKREFSIDEEQIFEAYETGALSENMASWKQVPNCGVYGFSREEMRSVLDGSIEDFAEVCRELCRVERIREIASGLNITVADELDGRWLYFRYLQAKFIYGLCYQRLYHAGRGNIPGNKNLEHDIHDMEYLILGLHAGCLATKESQEKYQKLGWKFKLLRPDARIINL